MYELKSESTRAVAVSTGNPVLDRVPAIPNQAMAKEFFRQSFRATPAALEMLKANQGELYRPIVSMEKQEMLLYDVVAFVRAGFKDRNLIAKGNGELFRHSLAIARQAPNVQGHREPREVVEIKGARPRGILFVTSARMGRRVTAERIAQFLGSDPMPIELMTPGGRVTHWYLPVLRVNWSGRLDDFLGKFLTAYGPAMRQGDLLSEIRVDKGRLEAEALAIMVGLCLGANLGLLIVERIDTSEAGSDSAGKVWSVLGQLTRATGIPVLCMATTGGASGLMRHPSASGELSVKTISMRPPASDSAEWADVCSYAYQEILGGTGKAPSWLVNKLEELTQCRTALVIKSCLALAQYGYGDAFWTAVPADFDEIVKAALYTEQASLSNVKRLENGIRGYTRASVMRFADWLAPGEGPNLVLGLQIQTSPRANLPPELRD
ncbi:hypothetical protein [Cupriavidus sp. USMAA2-4]|uniref:hypothetical protein n=1 Tax=Cupriavidus sp. USMAA2-4 TaxID=876364 RepID=UPI0012F4DDD4|nr:hypothetical protein [Cupriavidus sp. USMAA2-4]